MRIQVSLYQIGDTSNPSRILMLIMKVKLGRVIRDTSLRESPINNFMEVLTMRNMVLWVGE